MQYDPRLVEFARRLRRELSPAERILWQELRGRRFGGYRFRRQQVIEPYIADFYCASCALVLELDGETHLGHEEADRRRQLFLERRGLKVLRFWNTQVFEELESVLEAIHGECVARGKPRGAGRIVQRLADSPLIPNPSPRRGEGGKTPDPLTPNRSPQRGEGSRKEVTP